MTLNSVLVQTGVHACAFLVSEEQRWEALAGFVADGLHRDEHVSLHGMTPPGERLLFDRLYEDGTDAVPAQQRGQLVLVQVEESENFLTMSHEGAKHYLRHGVDQAMRAGYSAARISGVLSGSAVGPHEETIDRLVHERAVTVFCPYLRAPFSPIGLAEVIDNHDVDVQMDAVHDDGLLRITRPMPGGLRLAGEVDPSNHQALLNVLAVARMSGAEVKLDLASLRFIDPLAVEALLEASAPRPGLAAVRWERPRVLVRRLVRLLDAETARHVCQAPVWDAGRQHAPPSAPALAVLEDGHLPGPRVGGTRNLHASEDASTVDLDLVFDHARVSWANTAQTRSWLRGHAKVAGLPGGLVDEFLVVAHEAVATGHATTPDRPTVQVKVWHTGHGLVCDVVAGGGLSAVIPQAFPSDLRLQGLWMADQVCRQIRLRVSDCVGDGDESQLRIEAHHQG